MLPGDFYGKLPQPYFIRHPAKLLSGSFAGCTAKKKAQIHHLDLRFSPLDGIIIKQFQVFVKADSLTILHLLHIL